MKSWSDPASSLPWATPGTKISISCPHCFCTQISWNGNRRLTTNGKRAGILLIADLQSWLLHHLQLFNERISKFYIPIHKVLEQPLIHLAPLKLCKGSQIPHPWPRVASTSNRIKTHHHWLYHLSSTNLCHLSRKKTEGKLPNPCDETRKSWTQLSHLFIPFINKRNKKTKLWIHPAFSFRSAAPGTKRTTYLLGRQG